MAFSVRTTSRIIRSHVPLDYGEFATENLLSTPKRLLQRNHDVILEVRSSVTHPHLRLPNGLPPGQEMLGCQAGRACPRGLETHPIAHTGIVHHDEDVAVTPVLIQAIITQRPTCSNI